MKRTFIPVSELASTPPEFPKVIKRKRTLLLRLEDGRQYDVADNPVQVLGLLHHFAGKIWADHRFFFHAIARIADARGWRIHPFA